MLTTVRTDWPSFAQTQRTGVNFSSFTEEKSDGSLVSDRQEPGKASGTAGNQAPSGRVRQAFVTKPVLRSRSAHNVRARSDTGTRKPAPNLLAMDPDHLKRLELVAMEHDLWSNSRNLPNSSFKRWGLKPWHCYNVCDCHKPGCKAEHAKPPNSELLEFIEREVPPEIRRYMGDEDKLKLADKELSQLWERPRKAADPTELPPTRAELELAREQMRKRLAQKLRSFQASGRKALAVEAKLQRAIDATAHARESKQQLSSQRASAQLDRLASQPESELDPVPVIAASPPKPFTAPKVPAVKPPPAPATLSTRSTATQRQISGPNSRAPAKPKQKLFGGKPVKATNAPQSPLPLRSLGETQLVSTMQSTQRLPVAQPTPEDVTFAKAQDFVQQKSGGGVVAAPAAGKARVATDVFGAPAKPLEHQNIAAVLAQRDEEWQPVARQGASPTADRKLKLRMTQSPATVSHAQQQISATQHGHKQCVCKCDVSCKSKKTSVATMRPAGIKTPKSTGVDSALRWFQGSFEDVDAMTSSQQHVSCASVPAGLPRGPSSHLFTDHVRDALIWRDDSRNTDCDCCCVCCTVRV